MTPDDLRARLRKALEGKVELTGTCTRCGGTGQMTRQAPAITQSEVAEVLGVGRTAIPSFLSGRQEFGMAKTLLLLAWLDEHEDASPAVDATPEPETGA